jgi:hypothetical protein
VQKAERGQRQAVRIATLRMPRLSNVLACRILQVDRDLSGDPKR